MLSILIPIYNYPVEKPVKELHAQLLRENVPFEIICLDDCSAKNVNNPNLFLSENIKFEQNPKNLGRTATRNILAKMAQYDWLLFLDADVIPADNDFIKRYISYLKSDKEVVFGGCKYAETHCDNPTLLRWKYGRERETVSSSIRNKNLYQHIFSGNLLIQKEIFLSILFPNGNFYGMDVFCAYELFQKKANILHIDNPVIHLGLEKNEIFFNKCLEAVAVRKQFLLNKPEIEKISPLLRHYKRLKRYKLVLLVKWLFAQTEPFLKKKILAPNPSLFCLDLYRLGYICLDKT
ncbi:MAG TPA: glycosyltransferase family 2 protein [Flavobacterium sp.]|nr:glycosyltransferase family 2 protein [Flavobacterium sp.]